MEEGGKRGRRAGEAERQTAVDAWKAVERKGKEQQKEAERERREGGESEWGGKGEQEQYVERKVLHCTWLFTENEGRVKVSHPVLTLEDGWLQPGSLSNA